MVKTATVLLGIWMVRNNRVWEGKWVSPAMAVEWSLKQINEWKQAVSLVQGMRVASNVQNQAVHQDEIKWQPLI